MKKILRAFLIVLFSMTLYAEEHYIFLIDASGSMTGVPMLEAKDAMIKIAKHLFLNNGKISVMIGDTVCQGEPLLKTPFIKNMKELKNILSNVQPSLGGNNISLGFKHAQAEMIQKNYKGHIYIFGDCDGLTSCEGIENQAKALAQQGKLIPFTYLSLEGCTVQEKNDWKKAFVAINKKSKGSALSFDYQENRQEPPQNQQYFSNVHYLNHDGSKNSGASYRNNPWRCIASDKLLWLAINHKEQNINFFMKEPKTNNFYKKNSNNLLINDFIKSLNHQKVCGKENWRVSDIFELSRLTQLGSKRRVKLFPYLLIWPHISISTAYYTGYRKGIDLNNGKNIYEYREDRPYAVMFVAGDINRNLFNPSLKLLTRYKVINQKGSTKKPPVQIIQKDDVIDDIRFQEIEEVEPNRLINSNIVTIQGINTSVNINVSNGEFRINRGSWSSGKSTIKNGDMLQLRHISSTTEDTLQKTELLIGIKKLYFISKTKKHTLKKDTEKDIIIDRSQDKEKKDVPKEFNAQERGKGSIEDATGGLMH